MTHKLGYIAGSMLELGRDTGSHPESDRGIPTLMWVAVEIVAVEDQTITPGLISLLSDASGKNAIFPFRISDRFTLRGMTFLKYANFKEKPSLLIKSNNSDI